MIQTAADNGVELAKNFLVTVRNYSAVKEPIDIDKHALAVKDMYFKSKFYFF